MKYSKRAWYGKSKIDKRTPNGIKVPFSVIGKQYNNTHKITTHKNITHKINTHKNTITFR